MKCFASEKLWESWKLTPRKKVTVIKISGKSCNFDYCPEEIKTRDKTVKIKTGAWERTPNISIAKMWKFSLKTQK